MWCVLEYFYAYVITPKHITVRTRFKIGLFIFRKYKSVGHIFKLFGWSACLKLKPSMYMLCKYNATYINLGTYIKNDRIMFQWIWLTRMKRMMPRSWRTGSIGSWSPRRPCQRKTLITPTVGFGICVVIFDIINVVVCLIWWGYSTTYCGEVISPFRQKF